MRILGIDPGFDRCGWCILEKSGSRIRVITSGCIQTSPKDTVFQRFAQLQTECMQILTTHKPTTCGIETLFFAKNVTTALKVSEARGILFGCMLQHGIEIAEYTPSQIKSAVTGNGKATKPEILRMILLLTKSEKLPKLDDETDAIAVALCHAACIRT